MMLDLAGVQAGSRVLDVAAGTGESTLMAAARVGSTGNVVAADVSASMLNVAAEAARKAGMTNVETRVMNAENLELDTDSFDAVICRNALMLFSNPAKALTEMRRVVKPGGKVAVMVLRRRREGIRTMEIPSQDSSPLRKHTPSSARTNPGCTHSEIRERLKTSTVGAGFLNVSVHAVPIQRRFPVGSRRCWKHEKRCG